MPRGDKSAYSGKQKRKAEHIEEGYEDRGVGKQEAERRAWATVNKESGGGEKSGSGRGKPESRGHAQAQRGFGEITAGWSKPAPISHRLNGALVNPLCERLGAFLAFAVAVDQIGRHVTREQGELQQLFHHVDDAIVIG
jgi:hypothetical protein